VSDVREFIPVVLAAALCGCAALTREPYEQPALAAPAAWLGQTAETITGWPEAEWWKAFGSAELESLIAEAQANNYDLRAAAARVAQARADARVANASLWPLITASADATRTKVGRAKATRRYEVGAQASYEVDIWGRNRSIAEAAEFAVASSQYGQEVVRLALAADVARTYFLLLSIDDAIRVAEANVANARRLLDLVQTQRRAGRVSALEVERQETLVANAVAVIPPLLQERQVSFDTLALLLGRPASGLKLAGGSLHTMSPPPATLGVPSELLERRPDIRRAEAELRSANANIAAARAALFPSLILSAEGGYVSAAIDALFSPGKSFSVLGLGLIGTIFDGGRLAGQVDFAEARKLELVETYRQTVMIAFQEVEDALAGIRYFADQEQAQQQAVVHAREAYRLAEIRYRGGAVDFTTVLDAQRVLLAAESAVDQTRFSRFASVVGLYRALGGGWQEDPRHSGGEVPESNRLQ
jgi:multidrug efflux system outer membrane protein